MRLQRALARAGVASRRAAETLITDGKVKVDGKPATLGMKVDPAKQRITVSGRPVKLQERRWLAFHKPMGVVTTPSGLWKASQRRATCFTGRPETVIRCRSGSTFIPRVAGLPSTRTFPSSISCSAARREATPARASARWSRMSLTIRPRRRRPPPPCRRCWGGAAGARW
jgi:hypothetical protein